MLKKNEILALEGEGGEAFCQSGEVLSGCLGFGREMCLFWGFFWGGKGKYFLLLIFQSMIFIFIFLSCGEKKVRVGPCCHSVLCLRMSI